MLYHLLKSTLHSKAKNAFNIGTFIRFYMQSTLHSKANACNIGTFIRFYIQMRVQKNNKAFAYRFYRPFTQQCTFTIIFHKNSLGCLCECMYLPVNIFSVAYVMYICSLASPFALCYIELNSVLWTECQFCFWKCVHIIKGIANMYIN